MSKLSILHYSFGLPPKATGGLPLYVRDLANAQRKHGYDVNILLPKQRLKGKDGIFKKDNIYYLDNSLPVSSIFGMKMPNDYMRKYNYEVIKSFFNEVKPTVVHIHSFMGLPREFLEIAKSKKIKLVYTTHDYYGLCLKCNFIDASGDVCKNKNSEKCAKCNLVNGLNTKMTYLIGSDFYKKIKKNQFINNLKTKYRTQNTEIDTSNNLSNLIISNEQISAFNNLQNYYVSMFNMIDYFHFNSTLTKNIYMNYLPNIKGEVIPITLEHIKDNRKKLVKKKKNVLTFGYIGRNEPYKGIDFLMETLNQLDKEDYNFNCLLYGDNFIKYDKYCNGKVKNMGTYDSSQLIEVLESIDILIVPSIWFETFGFVVLEALSYGVPVLASENVGAKDLIDLKNIFKLNDTQILKNLLIKSYQGNHNNEYLLLEKSIDFDIYKHSNRIIDFYK